MLRKGCWEHVCKNSRRWGACLLVCGDSESTQHALDAGNFCLDRLGLALAFALALRELAVLALEGGLEIRQKAGWHAAVALVLLHRKRPHLAGQVDAEGGLLQIKLHESLRPAVVSLDLLQGNAAHSAREIGLQRGKAVATLPTEVLLQSRPKLLDGVELGVTLREHFVEVPCSPLTRMTPSNFNNIKMFYGVHMG
jgi:hypothetical protein